MNITFFVPIAVIALVLIVFRLIHHIFMRRLKAGRGVALRPLAGYDELRGEMGKAIESGQKVHITLGQGNLAGTASQSSVAALDVLDYLAADGCTNDTPPLVTAGEGTIMVAAQDKMRQAFDAANRSRDYSGRSAQFVAHDTNPYAYAAGVSATMGQEKVVGNVLMGHMGPELAIMAVTGERKKIDQIIGTDDPTAMAVATAVTDKALIGEELFAAGAYLAGRADQVASIRIQDVLRWLTMAAILIWAILTLILGI